MGGRIDYCGRVDHDVSPVCIPPQGGLKSYLINWKYSARQKYFANAHVLLLLLRCVRERCLKVGLGYQGFADKCLAGYSPDSSSVHSCRDLDAQLISGRHRFAEAGIVDRHKVGNLLSDCFIGSQIPHDAGYLGHGLDDQYARHYRVSGKMPLEKRFVDRDIFYTYATYSMVHFNNPVYHQKWIAMRQDFHDFIDIKLHFNSPDRSDSI